jgi:hypothetical protein
MTLFEFQNIVSSLGGGIISNALYDTIKRIIFNSSSKEELIKKLKSSLHLNGVKINAASFVTIIANKGFIKIEGSKITSNSSITLGSALGGEFIIGNNSTSQTDKSSIVMNGQSFIHMTGNSKIEQTEDGSINFHT